MTSTTTELQKLVVTVPDYYTDEYDGSKRDHYILIVASNKEELQEDITNRIKDLVSKFDSLVSSMTPENSTSLIKEIYGFFEYGNSALIDPEKYGNLQSQFFVNAGGYRFDKATSRDFYIQTAEEWFEAGRVN